MTSYLALLMFQQVDVLGHQSFIELTQIYLLRQIDNSCEKLKSYSKNFIDLNDFNNEAKQLFKESINVGEK
jgi:hypothetical protein